MDHELETSLRDLITKTFDEWIPFNRVLGVHLTEVSASRAVATLAMQPDLVGNPVKGILHGGVISATLDAVGGMAALAAVLAKADLDDEARVSALNRLGTIDIRVDYLRPAGGRSFVATAHPMRAGNTVAVSRMELKDENDEIVAVGTGTYIVG